MAEPIAPAPTCGTCFFGRPFRDNPRDIAPVANAVECFGVPPTPAMMAAGPQGAAIGLLRPRLNKGEPACALWAQKAPAIVSASS